MVSSFLRLTAATLLTVTALAAEPLKGRWDAEVTIDFVRIPFTLHFEGEGPSFTAALAIGETRTKASEASFDGTNLRLAFPNPAARFDATLRDGQLTGRAGAPSTGMHPFKAQAFCTCGFVGEAGPAVSGTWTIPTEGWQLVIRRVGDDTFATLTRDGTATGPFAGRYNGAFFELSYFNGQHGAVLELEQRPAGLELTLLEPGALKRKLLAQPADTKP